MSMLPDIRNQPPGRDQVTRLNMSFPDLTEALKKANTEFVSSFAEASTWWGRYEATKMSKYATHAINHLKKAQKAHDDLVKATDMMWRRMLDIRRQTNRDLEDEDRNNWDE